MKQTLLITNLLFFVFFAFTGHWAQARVFAEPYVGLAKHEIHFDGLADISNGFALGAKLGLTLGPKYFFAGDYMQGGPFKFGDLLNSSEITNSMMGFGIGADYRVIRFWAGYYFDNEFTVTPSNQKITGTAIKIGFGIVASHKFRANLEVAYHTIKKFDSTTPFGATTQGVSNDSTRMLTTMVTLSIPINLR